MHNILCKVIKGREGMTLIEIIVAIVLLGIILIPVLSMFDFSSSEVFTAGSRSDELMEIQTIVDDLHAQDFSSKDEIENFLAGNNYTIKENTVADVNGYEVTITKNLQNGTREVKLTTYLIVGGD